VESPELVAARIRRALRVVPPDRLVINPDCGLRHLPPGIARAKLAAMVAGAAQVRADLGTRRGQQIAISELRTHREPA
jgi:5-methyltetrahydropteroyltriglutamate--homocysteine methyltransferase